MSIGQRPKVITNIIEGALIVLISWASICLFLGIKNVISLRYNTLSYDYIITVLLTGLLSGLLAIFISVEVKR